ncbi:MAG TPA: efflux RND transporter periplasmic adaptor subunit [Burkholderiales bacterium]|nr:efflux RND transporter periplasmic adaptor subunit [Burkholderiales bacterium]
MRVIACSILAISLAACGPAAGPGGKEAAKKGGPGAGMPPPEVNVALAEPRDLPQTFEYAAQTAGSREVEVRARVTGILLKRNFAEGEPVKAGQSLYSIDPAPFEAALQRAEANVAGAEARYEQARRNAARYKPLYAERAVSQKEFDDAVSSEAITAADVKSARAQLTDAKLNLAYTRVDAPASGISGRSLRQEGSLVSGPDVLLTTITQVDPIWVYFGVPDNEQAAMQKDVAEGRLVLPKNGRFEVELRRADGSIYPRKGKVNFSDVRVSPTTGTREVRAEVPNPEGALRPGEFARVILHGAVRPHAVTVPQRAVLEGPQGKFVYLVSEKGTAEIRPVEAGPWSGEQWIITSGLKGGEKVIVDGVMKLGPGAPVKIAEPQKPAAEKKK